MYGWRAQGNGELAALAQSFNSMVETLEVTQRQLLHKEKLASMGQLSAGVAHELNNPLGTILLFSDLLHKEMPEDDPRRATCAGSSMKPDAARSLSPIS